MSTCTCILYLDFQRSHYFQNYLQIVNMVYSVQVCRTSLIVYIFIMIFKIVIHFYSINIFLLVVKN